MARSGASGLISVNQSTSTVVVDYSRLITSRPPSTASPPIDAYYIRAKEIVRLSGETWCNEQLLCLLAVDLVGTVELYVRSVLVGLTSICPLAKGLCDRKHVSIAAVSYYSTSELAYAVLDHAALSDSKAISNAVNNLAGLVTNSDASLTAALESFDRICHLRHAVTHQTGRLGPHNLLELGVEATQPSIVALDALKLQDLVATCHAVVRAFNQFLFEQTVGRWASSGLFCASWDKDESLFRALCQLLVSREDLPTFDVSAAYQKLGGMIGAVQKLSKKPK
jgi:hypothetical protein